MITQQSVRAVLVSLSPQFNCAALWWPSLQQRPYLKSFKSLALDDLTLCFFLPPPFISTCPTPPGSFPPLLPPPFLTTGAELQSVPLLARSPSTNRKYPPLSIDKLEEEINRRMADDNKLFREEFNVRTTSATCVYSRYPRCPVRQKHCVPQIAYKIDFQSPVRDKFLKN